LPRTPDPGDERDERYRQWEEAMDREDKRLRKLAEAEIHRRLRARERVPLSTILRKYQP
jgi:hypothetical protein